MPTTKPDYIIAIGASAGGLEEINSFFDHTPVDAVSYVIIQHLSADFKSSMVALLARHSKLIVKEALHEMTVQENEVYLIPNDKFMTVRDGKLYLANKQPDHGPHFTINNFLISLAIDYGDRSIGVILSGLGTDGTEGVIAIKKAGGMVIARDPDTSAYSSMPSHAIATGLVDFILEPALMPGIIEQYVKNGMHIITEYKENEEQITAILDIIKEQSPLDFSGYKESTILRRIKRRITYKNLTTLARYADFLRETPDEVTALTKDFLISVTSFFRDNEAFTFIQHNILPGLLKSLSPGEELKLWVAGCASGEEAYSLAILIQEQLTNDYKEVVVKIFATDIDTEALLIARNGLYRKDIEQDVSSARLAGFFVKEGNSYRVKSNIRSMVVFAQHDLVKNPPYCNMHFISCRNVLIYMTPALQKKIFLMLLFGLKMDGYLFLGTSESPMPIIQNLDVVDKKHKIYKNQETRRMVRFDAFSLPQLLDGRHKISLSMPEQNTFKLNSSMDESVSNNLAKVFECLTVCIDEDNKVIKSYGDTTKYLLQKNFTLYLPELLSRPLAVAFNTAMRNARKNNDQAIVSGITTPSGAVRVSISPLQVKKGEPKLLLVTFNEDKLTISPAPGHVVFDDRKHLNQYIVNLEEEMRDMKEKLHAAYEKLDASNENMQSFNEELLSANEEMQSTNEEMQSVNEELHIINADYQLKNKELVEMNDDLNNYFRSNINGQLFVNKDLLLMKFSPGAVALINLRETDVGRHIGNISTNLKFESIIHDIEQVTREGNVMNREIETNDGKWYKVATMPYVQEADNKHNGAVITFTDITELKETQRELQQKNNSLLRINGDLDNFINTASHDLLGPLGSIETSINLVNLMEAGDPEVKIFLDAINTSIKKFRLLISDIATIGKIEDGMMLMEPVDVHEVLNDIEWGLSAEIREAKAVINRNFQVNSIYFSRKNIRSILYNLISNAIKYRGTAVPAITISTRSEADHVIVAVKDNGIGIHQRDLSKIFEAYGRLNNDIEGQGIGLYLAKKIIDSVGGNITVESQPAMGSTFTLHLKAQ